MIGQGSGYASALSWRRRNAHAAMKILVWLFRILLILIAVIAILIVAYRFVTPVSTLMLWHDMSGQKVERTFVPLNEISPHLVAAVIASEDARFCKHHGVDWEALKAVIGSSGENGPSRGASTIPMQTAKNLFLWPSRSVVRKGLEIPLALILNAAWPKRRMLEIYLNIAEWGDGIFGAQAAARFYFHKNAHDLDLREAALLATSLPNPFKRDAHAPHPAQIRLARHIIAAVEANSVPEECLR
jgi:monofunctional biosynthetic peptidoglycan transglycosylase